MFRLFEMKIISHPHPARVMLLFILSFSLLSFVMTAPSIPPAQFNATDIIPRADRPQSHSPETYQPDLPPHLTAKKYPRPTALSVKEYNALVEQGKLMHAYLQGRFDLPTSQIQGPEDDDNVRQWYENHKKSLQSQGWVPSEPSETKADILQNVCRQTIKGSKTRTITNYMPDIEKWKSSSWEKQVS
jgi:hypothetical protein